MSLNDAFTVKAIVPARNRIEENLIDRSLGIVYFDKDNAFPNRCRGYVNASGSAKPCVDIFISHLYGNGFRDLDFSSRVINKKRETADDLLSSICDDMGYHLGFYVHVNYNALYEKVSWKAVPLPNLRYLVEDDDSNKIIGVAIYNDWAKKKKMFIDSDDVQTIDLYDPRPEVIQAQVEKAGGWAKYKGQVYCNPVGYTLPIYDCVQEDLLTDAGIKTYKQFSVESGFGARIMFVHKGPRPTKKDGGQSTEIEEQIEEFQSPEAGGSWFIVYAPKADQVPEIKEIPTNYDDKLHLVTRKTTKDDIQGAFVIPPGLLQATPGKLGTPEYNEAIEQYNKHTAKYRLRIERAMKELFSNSADPNLRLVTAGENGPDYSIEPVGQIQTGLGIKESLIPAYNTFMASTGILPSVRFYTLTEIYGISESIAEKLVPDFDPNADDTAPNS